jgi:hypothetical protein
MTEHGCAFERRKLAGLVAVHLFLIEHQSPARGEITRSEERAFKSEDRRLSRSAPRGTRSSEPGVSPIGGMHHGNSYGCEHKAEELQLCRATTGPRGGASSDAAQYQMRRAHRFNQRAAQDRAVHS